MRSKLVAFALLTCVPSIAQLPRRSPESCGLDPRPLALISAALDEAIERREIPGAVALVVKDGAVVYEVVRGLRVAGERPEPLTRDTIFDLASLTKCVATTSAVALLMNEGAIDAKDLISRWLPWFQGHGKERITVEMLLRHRGGLIPDNALDDYLHGREHALERIAALTLRRPPNEGYLYTDVGFFVLGELVAVRSGQRLDQFFAERIAKPLGLRDAAFHPTTTPVATERVARCAPTEAAVALGPPLRGVVHDPRSRGIGGVAGHAGLFATAEDLARYAVTLLSEGRPPGAPAESSPWLSAPALRAMLVAPLEMRADERRAFGFDARPFSSNSGRPGGSRFPDASVGHTGFTGTSIWLDSEKRAAVIVLTSRLHPYGRGNATPVRRAVGDLVGEALGYPDPATPR